MQDCSRQDVAARHMAPREPPERWSDNANQRGAMRAHAQRRKQVAAWGHVLKLLSGSARKRASSSNNWCRRHRNLTRIPTVMLSQPVLAEAWALILSKFTHLLLEPETLGAYTCNVERPSGRAPLVHTAPTPRTWGHVYFTIRPEPATRQHHALQRHAASLWKGARKQTSSVARPSPYA